MQKRHLDRSKMRIDLRARRRASRSSDDQGRFCVARGPVWGVCSDHRGSRKGRAWMMRCPAAPDLWQPTRKKLTALPQEVHEKITDFVWKATEVTTPPPREVREKIAGHASPGGPRKKK